MRDATEVPDRVPNQPVIREVADHEHDALGALTLAAYRTVDDWSPEYEVELQDVAGRAEHATVLVAVDGETLLGGLTLVEPGPNPWAEHSVAGAATIRMLAVHESARSRGVGEALTVAALTRARRAGAEAVVLHSATSMHAAHRLYERLGFERDESLDWSPEPGVDLLGFRLGF